MGKIIIATGGGGGVSSDELTVDANNVVKGYTYVGVDTDDEIGTGTLELTGNATNPYVLEGNTYYSTDPHTKNTGTMVDRRVIDSTLGGINSNYPTIAIHKGTNLQIGNTVTSNEKLLAIQAPTGYYDGSYVGTLASNLGDATAAYVYNGKYFTSSAGLKVKGTMTVSSVLSFSVAAYSTTQLLCTWKNPAQASGRPFSGVIICCKTGSYPTSPTDGYKYMGSGGNSTAQGTGSATISGLTAGTTYYLRIWAYCICSAGNYTVNSTKVLVSSAYKQATAAPTAHGRKAITSSGTFMVPSAVRSINIHCTGGGGSGTYTRNSYSNNAGAGGGGGGGYTAYKNGISVTPGQTIDCIVGSGGNYGDGGQSSASTNGTVLVFADGGGYAQSRGEGGTHSLSIRRVGGSGGSGGGAGGVSGDSEDYGSPGTDGASNGGNGANLSRYGYGSGQGNTTREFGSPTGTLYSGGGGGGGGGSRANSWEHPGYGGDGGGGNGGYTDTYDPAANGAAGTGGGGGGGLVETCGKGGSGNVIITW